MTRVYSNANSRLAGDEAGVVIIVFALCFIALLTVIALAIDVGNLYRTRLRLQKAADAAAVAGLGYRAAKGWTYIAGASALATRDSEVQARAAEILEVNLRASGIDSGVTTGVGAVLTGGHPVAQPPSAAGAPSYSSRGGGSVGSDEIWVTVSYRVPLLFLHRLPLGAFGGTAGPQPTNITVTARAQLAPANVAVVIDTSGSMDCPATAVEPTPTDPCQCRLTQTCEELFPTNRKIHAVREAVKLFIDFFNPNRDRISLVPFNISAAGAVDGFVSMHDSSVANHAIPFDKELLRRKVDNIATGSGTNFCDGIMTALTDMEETVDPASGRPVVGTQAISMVFFTDGAPTAGRFWFTNPSAAAPTLSGATPKDRDYSLYTIAWSEGPRKWSGPSPLIPRSSLLYRQQTGVPPADRCGAYSSTQGTVDPLQCVANLGFDTPSRSGLGRDVAKSDYRQQYYHCAIELADYIRSRRGVVYTIGVGPAAMAGSWDPYQNVASDFALKSYLLRRVAFDSYHSSADPEFGRQWILINDRSDPRFGGFFVQVGYTDYRTRAALAAQFEGREGESLLTDNDEELPYLFSRIAKSILLRLING